nr:MAG TPA: hypothetical protein [Caudoviricetes sp.]
MLITIKLVSNKHNIFFFIILSPLFLYTNCIVFIKFVNI